MSDKNKKNSIRIFEEKNVRAVWNDEKEKWWFSVIDIIAVLTESENPRHYWTVLKGRLKNEGNETVTNCERLNMLSEVATTDISVVRQPKGLSESATVAKEGAKAAKAARVQIEKSTGKSVVSTLSAKNLGQLTLKDGGQNE